MSDIPKPPSKRRPYALRFISGKYQGGEVLLTPTKEVVVGRSSDLEVVLVEDMVSRRHARIYWESEQIQIEDLGSTNGTFVNGEKVRRASLKEGDRVLIGTSILKLVVAETGVTENARPQDLEGMASQRRTSQVRTMSGAIDEIPLPDLLQLLASSKKSGVLIIRDNDDVAKIYLRKGVLYYALINDLTEVGPLKTLFRLLTWNKGLFDLEPAEEGTFANEIEMSVPELLMEGLRQLDEFHSLQASLPAPATRLGPPLPLSSSLRELTPEELDVFQLALNHGTVQSILDHSPTLDLDTAQALSKLLKKSYLAPV
jgi:pSer/pThr/pTyr-binding forkhead associated (FHA) protein